MRLKFQVVVYPLLFTLLFSFLTIAYAQEPSEVHVYYFPQSTSSEALSNYFSNKTEWKVIWHNLNDSASLDSFLNIVKTLTALGVHVIPPDICHIS